MVSRPTTLRDAVIRSRTSDRGSASNLKAQTVRPDNAVLQQTGLALM